MCYRVHSCNILNMVCLKLTKTDQTYDEQIDYCFCKFIFGSISCSICVPMILIYETQQAPVTKRTQPIPHANTLVVDVSQCLPLFVHHYLSLVLLVQITGTSTDQYLNNLTMSKFDTTGNYPRTIQFQHNHISTLHFFRQVGMSYIRIVQG